MRSYAIWAWPGKVLSGETKGIFDYLLVGRGTAPPGAMVVSELMVADGRVTRATTRSEVFSRLSAAQREEFARVSARAYAAARDTAN